MLSFQGALQAPFMPIIYKTRNRGASFRLQERLLCREVGIISDNISASVVRCSDY